MHLLKFVAQFILAFHTNAVFVIFQLDLSNKFIIFNMYTLFIG